MISSFTISFFGWPNTDFDITRVKLLYPIENIAGPAQHEKNHCGVGQKHAVSAYRILWVYAGFWWYHGILLVHLQDSVGAFGAKWLTKWLHHAKAPPHRGVLLWEWGNKDVHLVTTFVFCHVSKCYFFQQEFHCENVSAKCRSLVQVTPIELDFEVIFM